MDTKICKNCKLRLNLLCYNTTKNKKTGKSWYRNTCSKCRAKYKREQRLINIAKKKPIVKKVIKPVPLVESKRKCLTCKEFKSSLEFHIVGQRVDGSPARRRVCRNCYVLQQKKQRRDKKTDVTERLQQLMRDMQREPVCGLVLNVSPLPYGHLNANSKGREASTFKTTTSS